MPRWGTKQDVLVLASLRFLPRVKNSSVLIEIAQTYLQLGFRQWGAGNIYLLVLSSWKVNIAENPIAVMGR